MKTDLAFWDTSAIVPLCCRQPASPELRRLSRESGRMVAWWGTSVEARAALSRLFRRQVISESEFGYGTEHISSLKKNWLEVGPAEDVRDLAEQLPDRYGIRAPDAFQLAAALIWCKEFPKNRAFVCADKRLAAAAEEAGFIVLG